MKTLGIIILILSFIIGSYFQKRSSKFMKEDTKNGFFRRLEVHPTSFNNQDYYDTLGIKYRNISITIFMLGLMIFILFISLS
jgi:hypothetical protein